MDDKLPTKQRNLHPLKICTYTISSTELFDSSNGQWYMSNDLPQPHSWLQSVIVDNTPLPVRRKQ